MHFWSGVPWPADPSPSNQRLNFVKAWYYKRVPLRCFSYPPSPFSNKWEWRINNPLTACLWAASCHTRLKAERVFLEGISDVLVQLGSISSGSHVGVRFPRYFVSFDTSGAKTSPVSLFRACHVMDLPVADCPQNSGGPALTQANATRAKKLTFYHPPPLCDEMPSGTHSCIPQILSHR